MCEYISKPDCEKDEKAVTYRLHTSTYLEEIQVHCECSNPVAPVLPISHKRKGNLLVAEFKCNEVSPNPYIYICVCVCVCVFLYLLMLLLYLMYVV